MIPTSRLVAVSRSDDRFRIFFSSCMVDCMAAPTPQLRTLDLANMIVSLDCV